MMEYQDVVDKLLIILFLLCSCSFVPQSYYNGVVSYEEYVENHCVFSHTETNQMSYLTKDYDEKSKVDCYICDKKEIKCI